MCITLLRRHAFRKVFLFFFDEMKLNLDFIDETKSLKIESKTHTGGQLFRKTEKISSGHLLDLKSISSPVVIRPNVR